MLLAGHGPWAGHVLISVSSTHGLDTGDLPVIATSLIEMCCCAVLWAGNGRAQAVGLQAAHVPKTVRCP